MLSNIEDHLKWLTSSNASIPKPVVPVPDLTEEQSKKYRDQRWQSIEGDNIQPSPILSRPINERSNGTGASSPQRPTSSVVFQRHSNDSNINNNTASSTTTASHLLHGPLNTPNSASNSRSLSRITSNPHNQAQLDITEMMRKKAEAIKQKSTPGFIDLTMDDADNNLLNDLPIEPLAINRKLGERSHQPDHTTQLTKKRTLDQSLSSCCIDATSKRRKEKTIDEDDSFSDDGEIDAILANRNSTTFKSFPTSTPQESYTESRALSRIRQEDNHNNISCSPARLDELISLELDELSMEHLKEMIRLQSDLIHQTEEVTHFLEKNVLVNESTSISEDEKKIRRSTISIQIKLAKESAEKIRRKLQQFNTTQSLKYKQKQQQHEHEQKQLSKRTLIRQKFDPLSHPCATDNGIPDDLDPDGGWIIESERLDRENGMNDVASDVPLITTASCTNTITTKPRIDLDLTEMSSDFDITEIGGGANNIPLATTVNPGNQKSFKVPDIPGQRQNPPVRGNRALPSPIASSVPSYDDEADIEDSFNCQTDEEDLAVMSTQERKELEAFLSDDEVSEDRSYHDNGEVEFDDDEDDDVEESYQNQLEDLRRSPDLEEVDDLVDDDDEIRIISQGGPSLVDSQSNEEEHDDDIQEFDDGDTFMTQVNEEREVLSTTNIIDDDLDWDSDLENEVLAKRQRSLNSKDDSNEIQEVFDVNPETYKKFMGKSEFSSEIYSVLENTFGLDSFRENQLEAINATLSGEDVFVLMPTGGGKSLCYQLPALVKSGRTKGTTIVISPLISLMEDQVQHLLAKNIKAAMINSKATADKRKATFHLFANGFLDLIYLSPEMMSASNQARNAIARLYKNGSLARIVVDEAHCVSSWGHDFRPDYKALSYFKVEYPDIPVMALTATANEHVRMDIVHNLKLNSPKFFKQSFNRTNLYYEIVQKKGSVIEEIATLINKKYKGKTGIIYCHSKNSCEQTAARLCDFGIKSEFYHAGMGPDERSEIQAGWQSNKLQVICATVAFGMGIDKPDVRFVMHLTIPRTLEGYYQETGRAGRDGKHSDCLMFYSMRDARTLQTLIQKDKELDRTNKEKHINKLRQVIQYCENTTDCRRQQVLQYFNESFDRKDCKKQCDNCIFGQHQECETRDVTVYSKDIIKLVKELQNENVTVIQCQDIFKGSKSAKIVNAGYDNNQYHGKGKDIPKVEVERIFFHLIHHGYLEEKSIMNGAGYASNYLRLGPKANEVLFYNKQIQMTFSKSATPKPSSSANTSSGSISGHSVNGTSNRASLSRYRNKENDAPQFTMAGNIYNPRTEPAKGASMTRVQIESPELRSHIQECYQSLRQYRNTLTTHLNHAKANTMASDTTLKDMATKLPIHSKEYGTLEGIQPNQLQYFKRFEARLKILRAQRETIKKTVASTTAQGFTGYTSSDALQNDILSSSVPSQNLETSRFFQKPEQTQQDREIMKTLTQLHGPSTRGDSSALSRSSSVRKRGSSQRSTRGGARGGKTGFYKKKSYKSSQRASGGGLQRKRGGSSTNTSAFSGVSKPARTKPTSGGLSSTIAPVRAMKF